MFKNTETLAELAFVTAKSGRPSPFRSPIETEMGLVPVVKSVLEEKEGVEDPGVVKFKNTETLLELMFATAKSGRPSPFRSPIETEMGLVPVVKSVLEEKEGVELPGVVKFRNTETVLEMRLAATKSGLPSPFRSPIETEMGLVPVVKSVLEEKEGVELPGVVKFKNTEILVELMFATAKSGRPSPFRSPIETDLGESPVVKSVLVLNIIAGCALAAPAKQIIKSNKNFMFFLIDNLL